MKSAKWSRRLLAAGLAVMIFGALDPLEGSFAILLGAMLSAFGAWLARSPTSMSYWAVALLAIGIASLFAVSAMGGFGGTSGRSMWWGLAILPYPVGWVLGLVGAARCLKWPPATPT